MNELQRQKMNYASEMIVEQMRAARKIMSWNSGETASPRPGMPQGRIDDDPLRKCCFNTDYITAIAPARNEFIALADSIIAENHHPDRSCLPKITPDKLWVWGGPTPEWGGSMADDTLVRGAAYFNSENGVYVYGSTDPKMLGIHSNFKKLLCQVNSNCRTAGAQGNLNDESNAELLSKLSLDFPNVKGAMCDDMFVHSRRCCLPDKFKRCYDGLKKYNDRLKMYGVVYTHELEKDFSLIQPYIDVVNLWIWNMDDILDYDNAVNKCMEQFPGKKILQGIFLHDYGFANSGVPANLLIYQLDKVREYMAAGVVEGVVILGDREIAKWPESASAVKNYLLEQ